MSLRLKRKRQRLGGEDGMALGPHRLPEQLMFDNFKRIVSTPSKYGRDDRPRGKPRGEGNRGGNTFQEGGTESRAKEEIRQGKKR